MRINAPDQISTKAAGVSVGPASPDGKPLRQKYLARLKELDIRTLRLVREPDNKFDRNAIAIYADIGLGQTQLGYVQNRSRVCLTCSKEYQRADSDMCSCGGVLARNGLATMLAEFIDEGIEYKARVLQVTGGEGDKNYGLNFQIERVS